MKSNKLVLLFLLLFTKSFFSQINIVSINTSSTTTISAGTGVTVIGSPPEYTISATGSGSTTTITGIDNISVTGSAPDYTIGVQSSPTFTNTSLTGLTAITGTATAPTPSVGSNDNSIATTSFVAAHSSEIKTTIAQQTTTLATATAVTTLSTSLDASSTYVIRGHLRITCNNTGGVKLGANFPTGSTCSINAEGRAASNSTVTFNIIVASGVLLSNPYNTVNSTTGQAEINGFIVTAGTSGTFEFIFASTNAGETSSILNGYIEFIKVN